MHNTQTPPFLAFLMKSAVVGLAGAFILLYLFPGLLPENPGAHPAKNPHLATDKARPVSYSDAVSAVAPAVVNVYATQIPAQTGHPLFQDPLFRRFFGMPDADQKRNSNLGSGVLIDPQGYLLTNAHVIEKAHEIFITLHDGRQAMAQIVGVDTETDLAVLKINLENLIPAPVAKSASMRVGDVVLAIGNPYDLGHTVSQGIVSAMGRKRLGLTTFEDFIQTDAFINPGNSGGALIDARGNLIGINTAIAQTSGQTRGIGFAIPIDLAINVMEQLIEHGYVVRGWLGIEAQIIPRDIVDATELNDGGILVAGVLSGGPAANAGIIPGDIMMRIDGEQLLNPQQAIGLIAQIKPATEIEIELLRGWRSRTVSAEVGQRPAFY